MQQADAVGDDSATTLSAVDACEVLRQAPAGLFVVQDERIAYANPRMLEMFGLAEGQTIGMDHAELAAPVDRPRVRRVLERRLAGRDVPPGRMRGLRADGTEFDAEASTARMSLAGRPAMVVSMTDVSNLMAVTREAQRNAEMLARTESLCRSGSFSVDLGSGLVRASTGLQTLCSGRATSATESLDDLPWVPADERNYVAGIWRSARPGEPFEFQHRVNGPDGQRLIVLHRGLVEADAEGRHHGVGFVQDITAQREAELRAVELATHDEVTGLPNRAALLEALDAAMMAATWEDRSMALLAVEVPRIAEIKSTMGFGAGDTLAMALAARVLAFCADGESAAQVGDTEFTIMIPGPKQADVAHVMARASALRDALQAVVKLGETSVFPRCIIGVAGYPGDGDRAATLLENAQTARLAATAEQSIVACAPGSNQRAVRAIAVEAALRDALVRGELRLHYQPQVDLANGQVVGAEALLRWRSAELGEVSPAEFIPVAERSGLIGTIGDWVLEHACEQIVAWRQAGLPAVRVSVNLSPTQLQRHHLAGWVQAVLLRTGADPACLGIELTEGAAMADVDHAVRTLAQIRALGVEVSLDDFGTGYSSLACLRRLPIDIVKMDRSFVHDVTATPEDMSVTRSIVQMVHGLHMKVLAEGVETEAQLGLLASHSCDLIQGHLFSAALSAEDFAQLLVERRHLPPRFVTRVRRERTLLLVDDEDNIVSSLKRLFRADGYRILTARSGEEALRLLAETEADVILSDQRMPGMTGVDFLRRAKTLVPDSVRMVLSGYTELQSIIDAINEGAIYKFLTKPWDDAQLRDHVADAFRRKGLSDENRRLGLRLEAANLDHAALNARLTQLVEQQRAQSDAFASSAGQLREMLDSLPMPVFGVDADGTLVFGNREAEPLMQRARCGLGEPVPAPLRPWLGEAAPAQAWLDLDGTRYRVLRRAVAADACEGGERDSLVLMLSAMTPEDAPA